MIVEDKQVFNLWDTNGRRSDVLNALSIYIGILKDLEMENPGFKWASYPDSTSQYDFYVRALSASPEVFQKHDGYDEFVRMIQPVLDDFQKRNITKDSTNQRLFKLLDESIEQRARHYTSNLVRIGLATDKRKITPCGNSFYNAKILKDSLEEILPLNETNIILLRQLMKLKNLINYQFQRWIVKYTSIVLFRNFMGFINK